MGCCQRMLTITIVISFASIIIYFGWLRMLTNQGGRTMGGRGALSNVYYCRCTVRNRPYIHSAGRGRILRSVRYESLYRQSPQANKRGLCCRFPRIPQYTSLITSLLHTPGMIRGRGLCLLVVLLQRSCLYA